MARVSTPRLEDLPAARRTAIEAAEVAMGFVANDALIMSKKPAITDAFATLVAAIYAPGEIDAGLKRLIGLVSSAASGCQYCVGHTSFTSRHNGISDEKLADVWQFEQSAQFSAAERVALRVAMHAGQTPNGVTDEMFAELGNHYSEEGQLEIVSVIALFGFLNRWNSTLATDLEGLPGAALEAVEKTRSETF